LEGINADLYDFQTEGVEFGIKTKYSINACEQGLGKTIQALTIAANYKKALVICPAYLRSNWRSEVFKFVKTDTEFIVESYTSFSNNTHKVDNDIDIIIYDEAHYLKNIKAKRTIKNHNFIVRYNPKKVLLLTGTPILNRVPEIWSLLSICYHGGEYPEFKPWTNYYSFCNKFCEKEVSYIGSQKITKYVGVKNAEELKALIAPIYFRRRSKDVLDLPEQVRQIVGTRKAQTTNFKSAWDNYQKGDISTFATQKAVNALSKTHLTANLAADIIPNHPVVIFTDHIDSCHDIHEKLQKKFTGEIITGSTKANDRFVISSLLGDRIDYIVATIGSLSTGVNLQAANYMIFNDVPWVPAVLEQAEKRIHRIGQSKRCFYYYVINSDIDERIVKTIKGKKDVIREVV